MAGLGIQNRGTGKARVNKADGGPIVKPLVMKELSQVKNHK